jgi:hypothetical protein
MAETTHKRTAQSAVAGEVRYFNDLFFRSEIFLGLIEQKL